MLCNKCNSSIPDPSPSNLSSSSLQNLLRAQNSLPRLHTFEIRDIIAGLDVDTHQIRCELISLTNKLKRLEIQREKYKSLLAPIRRLPSEILNHIFTFFSYGPYMQNLIAQDDGIILPGYHLMAVCSRWRNIALSCRALWQRIWLDVLLYGNTEEALKDRARLAVPLKWCLDHVGETEPLEISFQANVSDDGTLAPEPELMCILFAQSAARRWGHLDLSLDFTDLESFPSLAALKNCTLTSLKSLKFSIDNERSTEFDMFCNAPQLTQLTLSTLPAVERKEMFPWGQIKTLELSFVDAEHELFRALAFCPNLESLSYRFSYHQFSEIPLQFSATICSLSFLFNEHGRDFPKTSSLLMDAACFPALQEMSINYKEFPSIFAPDIEQVVQDILWPQAKFTSFLLRSGCSLTTLEIKNIVTSNDDLITLLVNTPELCRFKFYETPRELKKDSEQQLITMSFIAHLHAFRDIKDVTSDGSANPLVPKLEHLSLRVLGDWFNVDQLFVDVVCLRWSQEPGVVAMTGIECLKSVELMVMGRELDEEVYKPLIQLRKAGLQIELVGTVD